MSLALSSQFLTSHSARSKRYKIDYRMWRSALTKPKRMRLQSRNPPAARFKKPINQITGSNPRSRSPRLASTDTIITTSPTRWASSPSSTSFSRSSPVARPSQRSCPTINIIAWKTRMKKTRWHRQISDRSKSRTQFIWVSRMNSLSLATWNP